MILVLTTVSKKPDAQKLAKGLIKSKFAACVNILKIEQSVYRWKGALKAEGEYLLLIKTGRPYRSVEQFILKNHPYELPEILQFRIRAGHRSYLNWILAQSR